jgi:DNA-directed RNA polymerase beta subunit
MSMSSEERVSRDISKIQQWWIDIVAPIINSYRMNHTLIEHQLQSYNHFVFQYIPHIVGEYSKISFWFGPASEGGGVSGGASRMEVLAQNKRSFATHFAKFELSPVQFRRSGLTVRECHLRDETYQFDILTNVSVTILDLRSRQYILYQHRLFENIVLCSIPIMVQSKICNAYGNCPPTEILDPGGYFVLHGKEKVVLAQEEYKHDYPFVTRPTKQNHNRYSWICEVRSSHFPTMRSTSTVYILLKKQTNDVDIEFPFCESFFPVLAIFRMMGVSNRTEILGMLCNGSTNIALIDVMARIVDHAVGSKTKDELAQMFVPKSSTVERVIEHANQVAATAAQEHSKSLFQNSLTNEFFPRIGKRWTQKVNLRKLKFLSFCIRKLVLREVDTSNMPFRSVLPGSVHTGRPKYAPDDKDILDNKRIKCTGYLLGEIFRQICRELGGGIFRKLRRKFNDQLKHTTQTNLVCIKHFILHNTKFLQSIFETRKITDQLIYVIATGNWLQNKVRQRIVTITSKSKFMNSESQTPGQVHTGTSVIDQSGSNNSNNRAGTEYRQTYATDQTGRSQSLTRHYPMTVLSHLRRVNRNLNRKGKSIAPRLLNESQWGIYCPVSTPEGKACGLLPQLALLCHIRHVSLTTRDVTCEVLRTLDTLTLKAIEIPPHAILFVNHVPIREVHVDDILTIVHALRYKSELPFDASIYVNETDDIIPHIHVVYDEGACLRPLVSLPDSDNLLNLVRNTSLVDLWPELVRKKIIQYKAKEEEFCGLFTVAPTLLAAQTEHTHMELYDAGLFSPEILIIPFMNHNQSPRNMFAMNLLRQSVSDIGYNYFSRFDPHNHRLWYPQKSIVQTSHDRDWNLSEIPPGQNAVVVMMCMPYNMEDAIVVNGASLDRGLFRSDVLETYTSNDEPLVEFAKPDFYKVTNIQNVNYQTLEADGLPPQGQVIAKRDAIVGRVSYHDSKSVEQAQTHARNQQIQSTQRIPSNANIPSSTIPSSTTNLESSKTIKSVVSNQSEHDMQTLRNHLLFLQKTKSIGEKTEGGRLAILQNMMKSGAQKQSGGQFQKDHSVIMQKEMFQQHMVVDQCILTNNSRDPDQRIVKVRLRQMRVPQVGDKLSSRHGQKGVIGRVMRAEDVPYTVDGQVPDLIINPHCMPSRMTIGQLLESLTGKALALDDTGPSEKSRDSVVEPCDFDSAAYFGEGMESIESSVADEKAGSGCVHATLPKIRDYARILRKHGYNVYGNEAMYDGQTGRFLGCGMFMGIVGYHRLRHMVDDKLYARAKGSVQLTTRQPNEGRSAEGGLRLGEMERDVFISHGATQVWRDRFLDNSDRYDTVLCNRCGSFANASTRTCSVCHDYADLRPVTIPYALKLLQQELAPAGVYMQFSSQKSQSQNPNSIFQNAVIQNNHNGCSTRQTQRDTQDRCSDSQHTIRSSTRPTSATRSNGIDMDQTSAICFGRLDGCQKRFDP